LFRNPVPRQSGWRVETLALLAAVFWTLSANGRFLQAALKGQSLDDWGSWSLGAALVLALVALHAFIVLLVANRWTVKPVLIGLSVAAAAAGFYVSRFGAYMDPAMLRNVVKTNPAEAGELIGWPLVLHLLLFAGLPALLLARVRVAARPFWPALGVRIAALVACLVVLVGAVLAVFQPLSSLMRNHKELRYQITPANLVWSGGVVAAAEFKGAAQPRRAIGEDARQGDSWARRDKPMVLVLVVGETARAANWGLSGYGRQTTPLLAGLPVVNFPRVRSCGTDTETSLPCMFAPVGRRDYDEPRIRGEQSLLHVLARAGVQVHWRDNQSGCKGVCEGLPQARVVPSDAPGLCPDGRCLDEALVSDLDARLAKAQGTQIWVLHQLGNHGPSYFRRYPPAFAQWQPECRSDDLRACTVEQIVNSYDNSLRYTDHVLAMAVGKLQAAQDQVDSALIYVSDHGESLGESGLFLHGIPYAIAPDVQTRVPMLMWWSQGLPAAAGLPAGCLDEHLRAAATADLAHDHLFHTVLGLMDVKTALYARDWDLTAGCRAATDAAP
jgi:lipid A ethanolaminephosphotransferase